MIKIKEIGFVCYPVSDMAKARAFYEGVLGLKASVESTSENGAQWVEYEIGPSTLSIGSGMDAWKPSPNGGSAALEVEDLDQALEHLKQNGVVVQMDKIETPVCHMAVISDPDGNSLLIHKRK